VNAKAETPVHASIAEIGIPNNDPFVNTQDRKYKRLADVAVFLSSNF